MAQEPGTDVVVDDVVDKAPAIDAQPAPDTPAPDTYVLPVLGVRVQSKVVNAGFWGGLVGAAAFGVVDPPLALLLGAGVVIARHTTKR